MSSHFRAGFLRALAENGINPTDLVDAVEKQASGSDLLVGADVANSVTPTIKQLPGMFVNGLFSWPAAAAIAGGGALGWGAAKGYHALTSEPRQTNIEDLKNGELANEIKLQSALLARKRARRHALLDNK